MAVAPTGAIYKSLYFDGEDSRDYGVYITGEAVYNAPEREVEMISIPGRNGALAMDRGRFENIEVTYPAGIFADNEADFAEAISNFRNLLCSKRGYVRLQDEYNPNEYRMAVYKSGLEVEPALLKAGEFDIVFDCKPQRFLTSGEEAVTVTSGGTLTNPTLFEASPLLMVDGYGSLTVNGYDIKLSDETFGAITLATSVESAYVDYKDQVNKFSSGDSLSMTGAVVQFICMVRPTSYSIVNVNVSRTSGSVGFTATSEDIDNRHIRVRLALDDVTYSHPATARQPSRRP